MAKPRAGYGKSFKILCLFYEMHVGNDAFNKQISYVVLNLLAGVVGPRLGRFDSSNALILYEADFLPVTGMPLLG